jgi:hypothetical protein
VLPKFRNLGVKFVHPILSGVHANAWRTPLKVAAPTRGNIAKEEKVSIEPVKRMTPEGLIFHSDKRKAHQNEYRGGTKSELARIKNQKYHQVDQRASNSDQHAPLNSHGIHKLYSTRQDLLSSANHLHANHDISMQLGQDVVHSFQDSAPPLMDRGNRVAMQSKHSGVEAVQEYRLKKIPVQQATQQYP